MRIVMINSGVIGSTGRIMLDLADISRKNGYDCITACPDGRSMRKAGIRDHIYIGNRISRNLHLVLGKWSGFHDVFSLYSTMRFLARIKQYNPDLIHLHNLHDCYINLPLLFRYIKKHRIKVIWTLHDCWSFTGGCPHFVMAECNKWKSGCFECPSYRNYPSSKVDKTKVMWKLKKNWFTGVQDLTIVTPSQWLADLVKQSYLGEYSIKVIHNGIDLSVFKPTESEFREKYNIPAAKKIILGVAFGWGIKKGLDVFCKLAQSLDQDKYQIVLVGTNDDVDKILPKNIISIHRTQNQTELAKIYTAADLFVNPTREEVLGLVNIEANACGTPVLTFRTGGSPECIDETCGAVIEWKDIDRLEDEIDRICSDGMFSQKNCEIHATRFDAEKVYKQYLSLYADKPN